MSPSSFFDEPTTDIDCGIVDQNQQVTTVAAARSYAAQGSKIVTAVDQTSIEDSSNSALIVEDLTLPITTDGAGAVAIATSETPPPPQLIGPKDCVNWNEKSLRVSKK